MKYHIIQGQKLGPNRCPHTISLPETSHTPILMGAYSAKKKALGPDFPENEVVTGVGHLRVPEQWSRIRKIKEPKALNTSGVHIRCVSDSAHQSLSRTGTSLSANTEDKQRDRPQARLALMGPLFSCTIPILSTRIPGRGCLCPLPSALRTLLRSNPAFPSQLASALDSWAPTEP